MSCYGNDGDINAMPRGQRAIGFSAIGLPHRLF